MKLTIHKFQQLNEIANSDLNDIEKSSRLVQTFCNMTEDQVDAMSLHRFNDLCNKINNFFNLKQIELDRAKPVNLIKVNGRTYNIIYDATRLPFNAGRYVEIATFSNDILGNMHKIMASIVIPVRFSFTKMRYVEVKMEHEDIADQMLDANFKDCYHAMVFFWAVFNLIIKSMMPYLEMEAVKKGANPEAVTTTLIGLQKILDGFTMPRWLRILRRSNLIGYGS